MVYHGRPLLKRGPRPPAARAPAAVPGSLAAAAAGAVEAPLCPGAAAQATL